MPETPGVDHEGAVAQQGRAAAQQVPGPEGVGVRPLEGFRQVAPDQEGDRRDQHGQQVEVRAPAEPDVHLPADHRPQGRRDRDGHAVGAEDAHRPGLVVELADDGVADHRLGAGGHALEDPGQDEGVDGVGQRAAQAGQREADHAAQQHPAPPDPVRERPIEKLGQGEAGQVQAHGELHAFGVGAEDALAVRQRGGVEVGREDADNAAVLPPPSGVRAGDPPSLTRTGP
jgi:hypothetical protein